MIKYNKTQPEAQPDMITYMCILSWSKQSLKPPKKMTRCPVPGSRRPVDLGGRRSHPPLQATSAKSR